MALTEAQQLKICRIFAPELTSVALADVLRYYEAKITAEVETQVGELIDEYFSNNVNRNVTKISPNDKNFGAGINPEDTRNLIRKEIASLLYLTDFNQSSRLERC